MKLLPPVQLIKNREKILSRDPFGHRQFILDALETGIRSVQSSSLVSGSISVRGQKLAIRQIGLNLNLAKFDKIIVVGGGKASGGLAEVLDSLIPEELDLRGAVNIVQGTSQNFRLKRIQLNEASHPIPNWKGVEATEKMVSLLSEATSDSLVLCLISGGGSALMVLPASGISLADKITTTRLLLKSGAGIEDVNCVRKHLSRIKGGQLARYTGGALLISIIVSDIIGNPIGSIASGPTAPDPTTFEDALRILVKHKIEKSIPGSISDHLKEGAAGAIPETPKQDDAVFARVTNFVLGDNAIACKAAFLRLQKRKKFRTYYLGSGWHGEARDLGENFSSLAETIQTGHPGFKKPSALVWGGEATVTVRGKGKGGRNQEEALAALNLLKDTPKITLGFMGTDGIDGFSQAAGAIIDSSTYDRASSEGLDPATFLSNNDSNSFFKLANDGLIISGPTNTNVNDIGIAIIE